MIVIVVTLFLAATLFFGVMAVRIAPAVWRESAIFREFAHSRSLAFVVLLFPLGPALYMTTVVRLGWLVALAITAACYLPGLVVAKCCLSAFDCAGTDRVRGAESAAQQALLTAVAGLIYTAVVLAFSLIGAAGG